MSIASVSYSHVFGINTQIRTNIHYVDQHTLMYSAGCNIIALNVEAGTQRYTPCNGYAITALTLSLDRRLFAAAEKGAPWDVSPKMTRIERSGTRPVVTVYEGYSSKKRRSLNASDNCASKEFVALSFSSDTKYLAAQGGAPDWQLHFYVWEKGKLLATLSTSSVEEDDGSSHEMSINPCDETEICTLANNSAKVYRYQEGGLVESPLHGIGTYEVTCHAWLQQSTSRLVLGTRSQGILILDSGVVVQRLDHQLNISSIFSLIIGFVSVGRTGTLDVYDRYSDDSNPMEVSFKLIRKIPVNEDMHVRTIIGNAAEQVLILEAENGQIYRFNLTEQKGLKGEDPKFVPLGQPYHQGPIISIDVCIRKPLVVTCSADRSIRIWNYLSNTCQLVKIYNEEPHSVSMHPSGLHLLIGFNDKLRLNTILLDDLRVFREVGVRGCRECRFSTGGHLFAATHGNIIQIFNTWTGDNVANFKGHNGRIKSLCWTPNDAYLVSAGADGAVYSWNLAELKRDNEYILKSTSYSCAITSADGKTMWAVGADRTLKEITESTVTLEMESDQVLTQIVLSTSGRMLFAGTQSGTVRSLRFPLSGHPDDFQEHVAHGGAVTMMRVSYDDQYLFTVSEDGILYSFAISEKEERGLKKERLNLYADEVLITKSDLEEKTIQASELARSLEELQIEHEYQLRLRDMNFNEKLKEMTERFMDQLDMLKKTTSSLRLDKEKLEIMHEEAISRAVDKHAAELHDREAMYSQQLMAEYDKYQDAQSATNRMQATWQAHTTMREQELQATLREAQGLWESRLEQKTAEMDKLRARMGTQYAEHIEEQRQVQEDIDTEIERLHQRYQRKLLAEREDGARLKGENGIMRKKFNTLTKDIDDNRIETARMRADEKRLRGVIETLEKEISLLKGDMSERDIAIQEKERRVYDLKKKNQELEKFKFVLDAKIKELKEQVEPRENHIRDMTGHIKDINNSLEALSAHKAAFKVSIQDLTDKLGVTKTDYSIQHRKAHQLQHQIKAFSTDIHGVITYLQDSAVLRAAVSRMASKYLAGLPNEELTLVEVDSEVAREDQMQQQVLRQRVKALRRMVENNAAKFRLDSVGTVMVNRRLIGEINKLRQIGKHSDKQIRNLEVLAIAEVPRRLAINIEARHVPPMQPVAHAGVTGNQLPAIVGSKAVSFAT
ncbi:Cilia- and flagella-associated protein 57 [Geranomyces variabilis]|nr:Cilia- and flagella-associated protein 57 [Geranomyces variabilis]